MSQRIDLDAVLHSVAKETGVMVTAEDPVIALVATHEKVLDAYEARWRTFTDQVCDRLDRRARLDVVLHCGFSVIVIGAMFLTVLLASS